MKPWITTIFTFFILFLNATPQLSGYVFEPVLKFNKGIKAKASGEFLYTAERLSDDEIKVSKYDANYIPVSSVYLKLMENQKYYDRFMIIDFEVSPSGQVVVIGQGNKSENYKKQKCYLIHYVSDKEILTEEIDNQLYLYQELLIENGIFYFCAAEGEVTFDSFGRYRWKDLMRNAFSYNPDLKKVTSGFINPPSYWDESLQNLNNFIVSADSWYSGKRNSITKYSEVPLKITLLNNRISLMEGMSELSFERKYLNQINVYQLTPFENWIVAFNSHNEKQRSEIVTQGGKILSFDDGEFFQDIIIDPNTQLPRIITNKAVYNIRMTYERALELAETRMIKSHYTWQKRGELETENEHQKRIAKLSSAFKDSMLTLEMNKILTQTNISVYSNASYQTDFKALRVKLEWPNDYFYTTNWLQSQVFEHPRLVKLIMRYRGHAELEGFDYKIGNTLFFARNILPPKILNESISKEEINSFETLIRLDFNSKSQNNDVKFWVNDDLVSHTLKSLGDDRFQITAKINPQAYKTGLKIKISSDLGFVNFSDDYYSPDFLDDEGKDCFLAYHKDYLDGFSKPSELVEAMNVCVIVANSNFIQPDKTKIAEVPMVENLDQALLLKKLLLEYYHYREDQVIILQDQSYNQMVELFNDLEKIDNSDYNSQNGAAKINLLLVILSHGSSNHKLITSDCKEFDISDAIIDLNDEQRFNDYVKEFLYIEDICFGSFNEKMKKSNGSQINIESKENFCRYATNGPWLGVMSSLDGNKVDAYKFIKGFNKSLEQNKNKEVVRLEDIIVTMFEDKSLVSLPLFLNLHSNISNNHLQKSFYFYTHEYLKTKDKLYEK